MFQYMVKRILGVVVTALVVLVIAFFLIRLIPGDPAGVALGPEATPERITEFREAMGLNEPLPVQFAIFLGRLAHGDLGTSIFFRQPVAQVILSRVETTFWLTCAALLVTLVIGIPLGVIAAVKRGTWVDQGLLLLALVGVSMPSFWLGLLLMLLFAVNLHWLPSSGFPSVFLTGQIANLRYVILPALTLGVAECALLARLTRSSMLDVLRTDYVRTARSKGLRESRIIIKHGLRNAAIPIVTVIGFTIAKLFAGAVVTETVFALPGIGRLAIEAILSRDYPVIQALMVVVALTYLVFNLLTDLVYGLIDPRVTYR